MHMPACWLAATLFLTFSAERRNTARDSSAQMQPWDSDIGTGSCNKFWQWHRKQLSFTQPPNEQKQSPNKVEGVQEDLVTTNNEPYRESKILWNSIQFCALPDPGHFHNNKCLASVKKLSRRLSIHHGRQNANHRTFFQESPLLHSDKKSWCLLRSAGWLECRLEA